MADAGTDSQKANEVSQKPGADPWMGVNENTPYWTYTAGAVYVDLFLPNTGILRLERRWFFNWLQLAQLHAKKNADYGERDKDPYANFRGSEEIGIPAWKGVVQRMMDKWSRIKTFTRDGKLQNEGFEDALQDNGVYSLICLSLFQETLPPQPGDPGFSDHIDPVTGVRGMDALDPTSPWHPTNISRFATCGQLMGAKDPIFCNGTYQDHDPKGPFSGHKFVPKQRPG